MGEDLKLVIRDNTRRLLKLADGASGVSQLIRRGLSNGNAQRVLEGQTAIGVSLLAQLAKALDVEPWQLCVPDLDPEHMPRLETPDFRWPFKRIDFEVISMLAGEPAHQVENGFLATLATAGIAPKLSALLAKR